MVANVGAAVEIESQAQSVQFLFPFSILVAAILIFGSRSTSSNTGRRRTVPTVGYPSHACRWQKLETRHHLSPAKSYFHFRFDGHHLEFL